MLASWSRSACSNCWSPATRRGKRRAPRARLPPSREGAQSGSSAEQLLDAVYALVAQEGAVELALHQQAREVGEQGGVEHLGRLRADMVASLERAHDAPQRVAGVEREIGDAVAEREHPALKRDGLTSQTIGKALAVDTLVHVQDRRLHRVRNVRLFQQAARVLELSARQRLVVAQLPDVERGQVVLLRLAEIMK